MGEYMGGKWKDAPTRATDMSDAFTGAWPKCKPLHCVVPVDDLGVWQGRNGYNQRLSLQCADGYQPTGGPAFLTCTDGGNFDTFARCTPVGTVKAGSWSSRVTFNGLTSLAGICVVGIAVFAGCRRDSSPQANTQDGSNPILTVAEHAEQEME